MKKLVSLYGVPSPLYNEMNDRAREYAASRNLDFVWVPQTPFTPESAVSALKGADAGIIDVQTYDSEIFSQIKDSVKLLVRYGVGFEAVNLPDASANGIAIARTTGANAEAVAEMAMAMILAAKRQLIHNRLVTNSGKWGAKSVGGEMRGKKLGLLGFGMIARILAKLFSGYDVEVLAYDPFLSAEAMKDAGARKVELDELFREADAISIHIPYTDEAYHLVNAERLALMKKNAVLVCTARGNIVDEDALYEALRDGKILGAGLDVYAEEPLPATSPLLTLDNAFLTPHVAAQTEDALWAMYKKAVDIAADFFEGKDLGRDLLNPDYKA